jgi:hypothetical protein
MRGNGGALNSAFDASLKLFLRAIWHLLTVHAPKHLCVGVWPVGRIRRDLEGTMSSSTEDS